MTNMSNGSAAAPAKGQAGISTTDEAKMQVVDIIEVTGSAKEYSRFLPKASALAGPILPFRADGGRVFHNVTAGVSAVLSKEERLQKELSALDLNEIQELPDIAKGFQYSISLVNRLTTESNGEARDLLMDRALVLRSLLLTTADALAQSGLLPMREVDRIRAGRGPYDAATDCVELATLFRENAAAISGKTSVTASQVAECSEIGSKLQTLIRPKGTPAAADKQELKKAIDIRDRFWTLLVHGHRNLWRAGAWVFGPDVDEHVPTLLSFTRTRSRKSSTNGKEAEPQAPAASQ